MTSTQEDYVKFMGEVAESIGIPDLNPDLGGLVSFRVDGGYTVNLQYVRETSRILCFIEVMQLPAEAGVAVYRDLLSGSLFGHDTAGGFFGLEPSENSVVYHYLFDFEPGKTEAAPFVETLESILSLADGWHVRLREILDRGGDVSADAPTGAGASFVRV